MKPVNKSAKEEQTQSQSLKIRYNFENSFNQSPLNK